MQSSISAELVCAAGKRRGKKKEKEKRHATLVIVSEKKSYAVDNKSSTNHRGSQLV